MTLYLLLGRCFLYLLTSPVYIFSLNCLFAQDSQGVWECFHAF